MKSSTFEAGLIDKFVLHCNFGPIGRSVQHYNIFMFVFRPALFLVFVFSSLPDINECDLKYCSANGQCVNYAGGYKCVCEKGFRAHRKRCIGTVKNEACMRRGRVKLRMPNVSSSVVQCSEHCAGLATV